MNGSDLRCFVGSEVRDSVVPLPLSMLCEEDATWGYIYIALLHVLGKQL